MLIGNLFYNLYKINYIFPTVRQVVTITNKKRYNITLYYYLITLLIKYNKKLAFNINNRCGVLQKTRINFYHNKNNRSIILSKECKLLDLKLMFDQHLTNIDVQPTCCKLTNFIITDSFDRKHNILQYMAENISKYIEPSTKLTDIFLFDEKEYRAIKSIEFWKIPNIKKIVTSDFDNLQLNNF